MMERKVLLAVDGSVNSMGAVHYAAQMASTIEDLYFVLMCVQPTLSQYLLDEAHTKPKARMALEKAMKVNKTKADGILNQTVQRLKRKGVDEDRVECLTIPCDTGVANDLLVMGQNRTYDAILVGRRGASRLREWVMGSVTANLVAHSKVIPIWVVDGKVNATKVFLAADGSRPSLRALDHMAFMLSGDSDKKIHVLHVRPRFQDYCVIGEEDDTSGNAEDALQDGDRRCMKDFYSQALTVLEKNGLDPGRLEMETLDGNLSVSRAIVQYAREHQFGTIVLGRSGGSGNIFTGSVSSKVISRARDTALWVVP